MLTEDDGDLLQADVDALVNAVNTVAAACKNGEVEVGRMFVMPNSTLDGPRWLINFPTKRHWKAGSRIEWVAAGPDDLVATIRRLGIRSIAVPPLGAGNGGLDWTVVRRLIIDKLGSIEDVDVHLYPPATGHHKIAGKPVKMTWGRAAVIKLVEAYVQSREITEPWSGSQGASALEIQKLMYFANIAEPKLRLAFIQGKYGPYSEKVRHLIQDMKARSWKATETAHHRC